MTARGTAAPRPALVYLWDADYPWDVRAEKICATCTATGYDVHIVARNRSWSPVCEQLAEGTVHRMPPWRWAGRRADAVLGFPAFFNPRWIAHLARVVRAVRPAVLVVRDLPLCPTAIWVGRHYGTPVVLDMAENYPAMMRKNFEAKRHRSIDYVVRNPAAVAMVERYCLPRVDRTLVVVEESGARVERLGVRPERISLVSNTPPLARVEGRPAMRAGDSGDSLTLVYVGILEVPRGISELIDAVHLLKGSSPVVRAVVIGGGRDAEIFRAQAAAKGLTSSDVFFAGRLDSHEEVRQLVRSADVGVLPHRISEAWNTTIPNKLFDYMAAALPVITSNAIPFERIVRETGAGVAFRSRDAGSLVAAIRSMFDPERRRVYGAAGLDAVRARYHWEYDAHSLVDALQRAAAAPSAHAAPLAVVSGLP